MSPLQQKVQPQNPRDLHFKLVDECLLSGFFEADLEVKGRHNLIFATQEQLSSLAHAKSFSWGTFLKGQNEGLLALGILTEDNKPK